MGSMLFQHKKIEAHVKKVPIIGIPMLHRGVQQKPSFCRGWVTQPIYGRGDSAPTISLRILHFLFT